VPLSRHSANAWISNPWCSYSCSSLLIPTPCTVPRFLFFAHAHRVNPAPYILHSTSYTLNRKTKTLNPDPEKLLSFPTLQRARPRSLFYAICDAVGLYVCNEANIESHGLAVDAHETMLCSDPAWEHAFLDRMQRMVQRDKNHSCIIVWSLGNESSYGPHHDTMADWTRRADPSRPVVRSHSFCRLVFERVEECREHRLLTCALAPFLLSRCMSQRVEVAQLTSSHPCILRPPGSPAFMTPPSRIDAALRLAESTRPGRRGLGPGQSSCASLRTLGETRRATWTSTGI